jgi:glyoxylase-like metal-dependent hydrolase (beta-lactamase superfamily II)
VILLTHRHFDHSDAAPALHEATGAPVRAFDPKLCRGGQSLEDGELIEDAGVRLRVLATPGHTSDSVCFAMESDAGEPTAVLTGDTILGRGTTVVAHPDGALGPYLDSLRALHDLGALAVLPGHGPELTSLAMVTEEYLAHREERLVQIRDALDRLGQDATARQIVEDVYADVDQSVWWAAELSVRAQLDYLRG